MILVDKWINVLEHKPLVGGIQPEYMTDKQWVKKI